MNFKIEHIDLFRARLDPAYDLEVDDSHFAFRTPGIPWCKYALGPMVILITRDTYEVGMYAPAAPEIQYVFTITHAECVRLFNKYLEGIKYV